MWGKLKALFSRRKPQYLCVFCAEPLLQGHCCMRSVLFMKHLCVGLSSITKGSSDVRNP